MMFGDNREGGDVNGSGAEVQGMKKDTNGSRRTRGVVPFPAGGPGAWGWDGCWNILMLGTVPEQISVLLEGGDHFVAVLREFEPVSAKGGGPDDQYANVWVNVGARV